MNGFTQTQGRGERLRAAIVAFAVLVVGAFIALAPRAALAAPAAGTVIGNQASATYLDASLAPRTATSNLVQTTVSQVKSFTLTAPGFRTASAGQTVYYPHTITNTGNGTDTFALNAPVAGGAFNHTGLVYYIDADGNGVPDNFTPIVTSGPIAAAGIFRFVVAGTVPGSAIDAQTGTITASVSDTGTTTLTNLDTTTVSNSAITVSKALSITSGPSPNAGPITVTLTYTNTGSAAAANLLLRDFIPVGMTYIPASGRWSVTGAGVTLTDLDTLDQGGIVYDKDVTTAGEVTATIASVPAGFSGTVTFQVQIAAGRPPGFINNTAQYQTSTQALTSTNTASYQVLQTAGVIGNGSTTDSTNGTGEPVTVAAAAAGSTITFTNVIWNTGNAPDTFVISMAGQASWPAGSTFTLLQSDGLTSLIANTTPSIPVYSAGCPAGFETDASAPTQFCGYRVILRVQLPVSATGGPFSITKTATSSFDNTKTDTVIDTLTAVTANSVDLTNNSAGGAAPGAGSTGTTVITTNTVTPSTTGPTITRFRLYVNNTGSINDSFNLATLATPAGWSVVFRADGGANDCSTVGASLTNTGTINAAAARLICAEVTVPITTSNQAAAGNYDFDFTATSALNCTVTDAKRDRVTVNAVNSVSLTPNNTQQTFPGGSVTYTHVLSNLGNVSETISFAAGFLTDSRSGQGWTSLAYVDGNSNGVFDPGVDDVPANAISTATSFALGVNASRTIFVRVFAPGSAVSADPANVTTITARYNAGTASAAATDSTTVSDGLVLLKEQVAVNCATPVPHAGYSTALIPSGPATAPGNCIAYRIAATNTTAAGITSVVVNDNIPANTTHRFSCGTGAAPGAATTLGAVTAPADGATGTVSATVGPLAPSQSAVVTFCVRIDP
ncbi:MAG: DUF11 domain-containing protein [Betaproteobacteria bacterium]|nr:DUF11 domain-containing protein [Betaproteobacteria bacterium]